MKVFAVAGYHAVVCDAFIEKAFQSPREPKKESAQQDSCD